MAPQQQIETNRHLFPDLVRAFALFGIVLVNVAYFAYPGEITYFYGGFDGPADEAAAFTVDALFLFKSYALFSMMFGVGLALQMASSARRDVAFGPGYGRRLVGLMVLGAAHVTVAFSGDILMLYALIGSLLYLFRSRSTAVLVRWGVGLLCLQLLVSATFVGAIAMGDAFDADGMLELSREASARMDTAASIYANGDFADIAQQRWIDWIGYVIFGGALQGPGVFAFFLFGLAGARSGTMLDPGATLWRSARRRALPIGLLLSIAGAWQIHMAADPVSAAGMVGTSVILLGAPLSSLGYLGLLAAWASRPPTSLTRFLARAGSASLTAYLLQSLILSLVFCGYGLGLYGRTGALECIGIAISTGIVSLVATGAWRMRFALGPAEYVLRRWTHGALVR